MIYFIRAGASGPVKIGFARDPEWRLRSLQVSHYAELKLLRTLDGGSFAERSLHRHFGALRIRGEWFEFSEEMLTITLTPDILQKPSRSRRRLYSVGFLAVLESVNGSRAELAKKMGLSRQAIHEWTDIPAEAVVAVEKATGIPREKLRPDLYRSIAA